MSHKAHIFDLDGTLAHSMPFHFEAWTETMADYGISFPREEFYALGGVPTARIVEILAEKAGATLDTQKVAQEKEDRFHARMERIGPLTPVKNIAEAYRGIVPLAVATGSNRRTAEVLLDQLEIRDWFDAVITADDIPNPKPAPDTFLIAAERIGVAPEDCCAYEDTDLGLQAIQAAGMHAVDVRPMYPEM